ncbi:DUF853 family protein [Solirubrobacter taibaiensis]|nr:DUF853 family protein [Solirubrobacter taibaiensis]
MHLGTTTEGTPLELAPADLTTHGVIVGMTGSGKTGLGIVLLEEALAAGIPTLILDPKGDMGNLAGDDVTIYTPGSEAGVPLNVIGSLAAPSLSWDSEAETLRDEIESVVTSLLGLVGIAADPLASREYVLLANLIEHAWRAGRNLDLPTLIGEVHAPPLRKLGVFDIDVFFPPAGRTALAMRLNGLIASPSFAAWSAGVPLDIGALLGERRAAIIYLAHLSDDERQFAVTLVLSKLVTWMRGLPGTSELRALVYMDEVFGFAPPTAMPPAKQPILTILKQARAFGVGMVLSTQNPVDLDYKAMANAGTWLVGRLQTENDKARVLEGLRSAAGGADIEALSAGIGGLAKRQFMLVSARSNRPVVFSTRDTRSRLTGPLTREQVAAITPDVPVAAPVVVSSDAGTPVAPPVAEGVPVGWAGAGRLRAYLSARVSVHYDDPGVDELVRFEAFYTLAAQPVDVSGPVADVAPAGVDYELPDAPIGERAFFRDAEKAIKRHVVAERTLELRRNVKLKLVSRPGESAEAFAARCDEAAQAAADAETAKLRDKLEVREDRLQRALETARRRVEDLSLEERAQQTEQLAAGAGMLLGALFGGRRRTRSMAGALGRSARGASKRRAAEAKVADATDDLLEVEREIEASVLEIDARWRAVADQIEPVAVRAEAADVAVERLALIWATPL